MIPSISIQNLIEKLNSQEPIILLDIRTKEEFDSRHIPGSMHIPVEELPKGLTENAKNISIVTICGKGGGRSELAAQKLLSLGFQAMFLEGGTNEWFEKNQN